MKRRRKSKKNVIPESEIVTKAPHSFIFHRGKVGLHVQDLIRDMRRLMEPYTASKLKVLKKNVLKDFAAAAGPLGVTHMVVFSRTEISLNMRLIKLPRGPTLSFKVHEYSLNRDVISALKKHQSSSQKYFHHPLLVMNNFNTSERHLKLAESAFQNMFPAINVHSVQLNDINRCLMLDYDAETDKIAMRHYSLKVAPTGVSSCVKKLMKKKLPDMGKYSDISEFFLKPAQSSDSEYEGIKGENEVELPVDMQSEKKSTKVGIKLVEIGPRLSLQLIKIQEGFCNGEVLYHKFIKKDPEEQEAMRKSKISKQRLKEKRRKEQEKNVARKKSGVGERKVKFKVEMTKKDEQDGKEYLEDDQDYSEDQNEPVVKRAKLMK